MADLLSSLESHLTSTGGIAPKLREHVERIDRYMTSATESNGRLAVVSILACLWVYGTKKCVIGIPYT